MYDKPNELHESGVSTRFCQITTGTDCYWGRLQLGQGRRGKVEVSKRNNVCKSTLCSIVRVERAKFSTLKSVWNDEAHK